MNKTKRFVIICFSLITLLAVCSCGKMDNYSVDENLNESNDVTEQKSDVDISTEEPDVEESLVSEDAMKTAECESEGLSEDMIGNLPEEIDEPKSQRELYWYETTSVPITYDLSEVLPIELTIHNDADRKFIEYAEAPTTIKVEETTDDCEVGYQFTTVTITAQFDSTVLKPTVRVDGSSKPVDLLTGRFLEDIDLVEAPTDYDDSITDIGQKKVKNMEFRTIHTEDAEYYVGFASEFANNAKDRVTTIKVLHPVSYNGLGIFTSGYMEDYDAMNNLGDEKGGWCNVPIDDYYNYQHTPYVISLMK